MKIVFQTNEFLRRAERVAKFCGGLCMLLTKPDAIKVTDNAKEPFVR